MTRKQEKEIELEPDAWQRFERAVSVVAKAPPQHRKSKTKKAKRKRATKRKTQ